MVKVFDVSLPEQSPSSVSRSLPNRIIRKVKRALFSAPPVVFPQARDWPTMPYQTADTVHWRPSSGVNFGDELARTTVELMLARRGGTVFDGVSRKRAVFSIGSVLHFAHDHDVIWGSGVNGSVSASEHRYSTLDVRAVRGPLTKQFLAARGITVPDVFGDPALLLRRLTGQRFQIKKSHKAAFVPNLFDLNHIRQHGLLDKFPEVKIIDPTRCWNEVVSEIASCEFVMASSLHGIIIAETFDIPAKYVRLTEHEGLLKYEDYFEGTGRRLEYARTISDALDSGGSSKMIHDLDALERAFPYDVWGL